MDKQIKRLGLVLPSFQSDPDRLGFFECRFLTNHQKNWITMGCAN